MNESPIKSAYELALERHDKAFNRLDSQQKELESMGLTDDFLDWVNKKGHFDDVYSVMNPSLNPNEFMDTFREQMELTPGFTADGKGVVFKNGYSVDSERVDWDAVRKEMDNVSVFPDGWFGKYVVPAAKAAGYVLVPAAVLGTAAGCGTLDKAEIGDINKSFGNSNSIDLGGCYRAPGEVIEPGSFTAAGNLGLSVLKSKKGANLDVGAALQAGHGETSREINQPIQNGTVHTDYSDRVGILGYSLFLDARNMVPLGNNNYLFPRVRIAFEGADNTHRGSAWTVVDSEDFGRSDLHSTHEGAVSTRRYKIDIDFPVIDLRKPSEEAAPVSLLGLPFPESVQFGFYAEQIENRARFKVTDSTSGVSGEEMEGNSPLLYCVRMRIPGAKFETSSVQFAWDRGSPETGNNMVGDYRGNNSSANKHLFVNYGNHLGPIGFVASYGYRNAPSTGNALHSGRDDKWMGRAKMIIPMFSADKKGRKAMDNYLIGAIYQGILDTEGQNLRGIEDGMSFADQSFNPISGFIPHALVPEFWYSQTERGGSLSYGISDGVGVGAAFRNVKGKEDEVYGGVILKF